MLTEDDRKMPDKNQKPIVSAILAMDQNQLIGKAGTLPWHLPADLQHFKKMTLNHPVIMGRKTYLSIGKPLPSRSNIILTHDTSFRAEGCVIAYTPINALKIATALNQGNIFIIGGSEIYKAFMPFITRLYITKIAHSFTGDTYFSWHQDNWREIERIEHMPDEKNAYAYTFLTYDLIPAKVI